MNEPLCPTCSGYLNYVPEYSRWYCQKCAAYMESAPQNPPAWPQQSAQPTKNQSQQAYRPQQQSMVYVQGQQPYQQQQMQPGQGKVCKQCGTANENWSVTCKSCRSSIC